MMPVTARAPQQKPAMKVTATRRSMARAYVAGDSSSNAPYPFSAKSRGSRFANTAPTQHFCSFEGV
jgi:hypothetical protein